MSLHVFANIVTPFGTAANNRGENEGNATTLQKIVWKGFPHTTVSAEAIRYALRAALQQQGEELNRFWNADEGLLNWRDPENPFADFATEKFSYIDDDLMGFMSTEAASDEASGSATVRRTVIEFTRAISITPWSGEMVFNAASPNATPGAARGEGSNPVPYAAEVHATRYQFGLAMTPERLKDTSRALTALEAVCNLTNVGGNHARFKYDFAPEAVILRVTQDPAPRMFYCFDSENEGKDLSCTALANRLQLGDIEANEIFVGCSDLNSPFVEELKNAGLKESQITGVKKAFESAKKQIVKESVKK